MKCGFAMGILALRALRDVLPDEALPHLTLVAAIEEECTGNGTLASTHAGVVADAALLLEPTDLSILLGGVGILWLDVEVRGRAAHAEAASSAVNAIDIAVRLLPAFRAAERELNESLDPRIDSVHPYAVNVGRIHGGDWTSSVPSVARLSVRVGYPMGWTPDDAEALVARHLASVTRTDPWLSTHPPIVRRTGFQAEGYDQPADAPLVTALMAAHRDAHGVDPALTVMATTTDARIYRNRVGIPAACFGPRTRDIHGIDEAVELASIVDGARTLGRFLVAWGARDGEGRPEA
jgi:acetylornithine deacetylase